MKRVLRRFCAAFVLIGLLASVLPVTAFAFFPVCGMEEHVHDDSCYNAEYWLDCRAGDIIHRHTAACYDSDNNLICHMADFVLHLHNQNCYSDGALVCSLPEIDSSVHSRADWASDGVRCVYVPRFSHVHNRGCYAAERVLSCELEESVHEHDSTCYESVLICDIMSEPGDDLDEPDEGETDVPAHEHDESCYSQNLVCEIQDGHQHGDDCYAEQEVLICDLEASSADLTGDVCIHYEYELHTHDVMCRDDFGAYVCGKYELESHEHNDACFTLVESGLMCGWIEHRHSFECYDWFDESEEEPVEEEFPEEPVEEDRLDKSEMDVPEDVVGDVPDDADQLDASEHSSSENIYLEFIKADSRGKPANSFADGSRVPEAIPADDGIFTELGTDGPSYEWLSEYGYLVDGALFGIEYEYYDEQGRWCTGYQTCWSGGVVGELPLVGADEPSYRDFDEYSEYYDMHNAWHAQNFWVQYVVDSGSQYIPRGKLVFSLPETTFEWRLTEVVAADGYDADSFMLYNDAGGIRASRAGSHYMEGSCYDDTSNSWSVMSGYSSSDDSLNFEWVYRNPGYDNGFSVYGSGSSAYYSYTGNILWNDSFDLVKPGPPDICLEFIKANAVYRPSLYDDDGNPVSEYSVGTFNQGDFDADYEYLCSLDERYGNVLIDGVEFELRYRLLDNTLHTQTCWSGGRTDSGDVVDDTVSRGKVVFRLPYNIGYYELRELSPDGSYVPIVRYADGYFLNDGAIDAMLDSGGTIGTFLWGAVEGRDANDSPIWSIGAQIYKDDFVSDEPCSWVSYFDDSDVWSYLGTSYTGNIIWNQPREPEFDGTRLEFIKANDKYRASPYDADGNVIEDYKVATFNDGDIEADYRYLLGLDAQYGDVLIDGVKFQLVYVTSDGEWHLEYCWSGGVDAEGNLVNDGLDAMGEPIPHGKVVFYLSDDIREHMLSYPYYALWELCEVPDEEWYVQPLDIACYSDTDFIVTDGQFNAGHTTLAMRPDAENTSDLSVALYTGDGGFMTKHWESYSGISFYSDGPFVDSLRPYTGNIIWNDVEEPEPEPEGTKLTFVKANSKYRASPYDADGNVIEDYKVATFNDGDIEADYQYLLDLDEQYGDVLIDGVEFQLMYYSASDGWCYDYCWSGGVDADGEPVNDGLDAMGVPIEHGKVVFHLPDDFEVRGGSLWILTELNGDTARYSDTDFLVVDEYRCKGTSSLVMESDAKGVWDLSARMLWHGDDGERYKYWSPYSGVSVYSGSGVFVDSRPYTGNIIWNDVEEEVSSGPMLPNTGGSGAMPVVLGCGAGLLLFGGALTVYRRRKSAYGGSRT